MAAEAAADLVARGYTAVKFDPAGPYTIRGGHMPAMSDIAARSPSARKIREAVGDRADLLFGTHGQFSVPGAIRLGASIEPYNPLWYEEPDSARQPGANWPRSPAQVRIPSPPASG
jgi:galactonate dehydratase